MIQTYDVVIIGNGIIGMSTALSLALHDPTIKIAVIGPSNRLHGATSAAGAMLGCYGEVTESTFKSAPALIKLEMAIKSLSLWPEWLDKINNILPSTQHLKINPGTYVILNSQAGMRETRNFNAIIQALNHYKGNYEVTSPDTIPGIQPIDTHRPLQSIFLPDEGFINSSHLLNTLDSFANQHKLFTCIDATVTSLSHQNHTHTIKTNLGDVYQSEQLILAAGAYTQDLINQYPQLSQHIPPMLAGVGCSLLLKYSNPTLNHVIRTPNRAGACGAHFLPFDRALQHVYLGASNSVRLHPHTHAKLGDVSYLMHWGMQQFDQNLFKAEIIKMNTGNRPVPMDTFPLLGETSIKGLWVVSGTFRDGVHDSPLIANYVARKILFNEDSFEHPFKPERAPLRIMTRDEAIDEVVQHYMSAGYEHGMELPKIGWEFRIQHMIKNWVIELYDELDTSFGISPEILMMLNQMKESVPMVRHYFKNKEKDYA